MAKGGGAGRGLSASQRAGLAGALGRPRQRRSGTRTPASGGEALPFGNRFPNRTTYQPGEISRIQNPLQTLRRGDVVIQGGVSYQFAGRVGGRDSRTAQFRARLPNGRTASFFGAINRRGFMSQIRS